MRDKNSGKASAGAQNKVQKKTHQNQVIRSRNAIRSTSWAATQECRFLIVQTESLALMPDRTL